MSATADEYQPVPSVSARPSPWRLFASTFVALLALAVAVVGSAAACLVAYVLVLVAGTGLLVWHRLIDGRASWNPNYAPSRALRRLAVIAAVLIVAACAANAFVWATEVAKR